MSQSNFAGDDSEVEPRSGQVFAASGAILRGINVDVNVADALLRARASAALYTYL